MNPRKQKVRARLQLESLEDRYCPALNIMTDYAGNMTITGTPDGDLLINLLADDTYEIQEVIGASTVTLVTPSIIVPGNVNIILTSPGDDNVSVNLNGFSMGGSLYVDTGAGLDMVDVTGDGFIPGSVTLRGANLVSLDSVFVGGNVSVYANAENQLGFYDVFNSSIGGSLTVLSGNDSDLLFVNLSTIGQDLYAGLGNGPGGVALDFSSSVGRNLTFVGGSLDDFVTLDGIVGGNAYLSLGAGVNNINSFLGTVGGNFTYMGGVDADTVGSFVGTIGGNVYFNMGSGDNELDFAATMGGRSFTYIGGVNSDTVTFSGSAPLARVYASLGAGADSFTLEASAALASLYIDFGAGTDTFTNNYPGAFTFPATLLNLP